MVSHYFRGPILATAVMVAGGAIAPAHSADIYKPQAYEPEPRFGSAPPPPATSSGWYVGGLIGYGLAETDINSSTDVEPDGVIGGGLVGWNFTSGGLLIGLEGDLLGASMEDSQAFGGNVVNASVDWMGGLRARAGAYVTPEIMVFGAIGIGWADIDLPTTGAGGGAGSEVFSGLQYGVGAEVALSDAWSARLDYLYTDLDSETIVYPGGNSTTYDPDIHQLRAGLVLHF